MTLSPELTSYLVLILVGFVPNEVWRLLGLFAGRGLNEESELIVWVRAVATAILAGVVAKLTLFPPGALAAVPVAVRIGSIACGLLAFMLARRSVFAGVLAGEIALILGALLSGV